MIHKINNEECEPVIEDSSSNDFKKKIEQAFSVTYLQASRDQIVKNNRYILKDSRWGIVENDFDKSKPYYNPDGSFTYAASYQSNDVDFVIQDSKDLDIAYTYAAGSHISPYSAEIFEKLIKYLTEQGIEVELFLPPMAPALWDRLQSEGESIYMQTEITELVNDIAQRYELKITGSYNPYEIGIPNEEFYDSRHARREAMGEYFDFEE